MIKVYRDWQSGRAPSLLGHLRVQRGRTGEIFDFAFDATALTDQSLERPPLDPDLDLFAGPQFPKDGRASFGLFEDSSPDRWGETLIARRFNRDKREGKIAHTARLGKADYLLGVHDAYRSGALRFKTSHDGPLRDDRHDAAAPPLVALRQLESAVRALENDPNDEERASGDWLNMLLAPGASLGGARPKATVVDPAGALWIAKFPSIRDRHDIGAWEFVVAQLASRSGLHVADHDARTFASDQHTFLVRRFDRTASGSRHHFASAMTLCGRSDGADAASGASYLEIAEVLMTQGASPDQDLTELWSRIAFNVMVSNTDDHLRNHGFLLQPGSGWRLSAAYDTNPVPGSTGLALNIDEVDNALDLDLVRSVAPYFRVGANSAKTIIERIMDAVSTWRELATSVGIARAQQQEMAGAFLLANAR